MKSLPILFTALTLPHLTFASLSLETTCDTVAIWEECTIQATINGTGNMFENKDNLLINGIDNFSILGNSESTRMAFVNGISQSEYTLLLKVTPKQSGTFIIGPANIGSITSNTVTGTILTSKKESSTIPDAPTRDTITPSNAFQFFIWIGGIILFIGSTLMAYYRMSKTVQDSDDLPLREVTPAPIPLEEYRYTSEDIIDGIRSYFQNMGVQNAFAKTIQELIPYEYNKWKQAILRNMVDILLKQEYAKEEINEEELNSLYKRFFGTIEK